VLIKSCITRRAREFLKNWTKAHRVTKRKSWIKKKKKKCRLRAVDRTLISSPLFVSADAARGGGATVRATGRGGEEEYPR